MKSIQLISLVVTIVGLLCFCIAFTFLFRHYYKSEIEKVQTGQEDIAILDDILVESKKKKQKGKKIAKTIGKIVSYTVLGVIAIFFAVSLGYRLSGQVMFFGNQALVVIASGSMSTKNSANTYLTTNNLNNQFNTFDIIGISRYEDEDDIQLYDVVAYTSMDDSTIVHRIIRISEGSDGSKQFYTRGDANNADDTGSEYESYLSFSDIVGYYNGTRIQGIGAFIIFLQSSAGIMTIVALLYCFAMFDFYSGRFEKAVALRSEQLLALVNFDFEDEGAVKNADVSYQETLIYKGNAYLFKDNVFVKKNPSEEDYQNLVYIKEEDGKEEIFVKDVETNEITQVSSRDEIEKEESDSTNEGEN